MGLIILKTVLNLLSLKEYSSPHLIKIMYQLT